MRLPLGLLLASLLIAQSSAAITVTDALTGQPLADAKVTLGPVDFASHRASIEKLLASTKDGDKMARRPKLQVATDLSGVARFEGVLPGACLISIARKGYVDAQQRGFQHRRIEVDALAGDVKLSIALTPTASLSGVLAGEDDEPLPGATFHAQLDGGNSYYGEVGEGGRFHLDGLEPGRYRIRLSLRTEQVRASLKPRGGEQWGYPVSFFHPGVEAAAQAEVMQLTAGIDHRVVMRTPRTAHQRLWHGA
ncbi:MAG: carboxypeptidase regulatory-like domain-containing protein [Acidobacteria bacterium]|nr:carboxypeptidase regulatory-like domain-containing protein [Acidobacteriota bacterium]